MDMTLVKQLALLAVLLAVLPSAGGQRTFLARLISRLQVWINSLLAGERLCPAGSGQIDLVALIPCGAGLPACPANLACQTVSTLCRNSLIQVTTSVCMPVRQRGQFCEQNDQCSTGFCQPGTSTCEFRPCRSDELSLQLDGLCYRHQDAAGSGSGYGGARQRCFSRTRGHGRLVSVNSADEQLAVRWLLAQAQPAPAAAFLGLRDARREGRFEWDDGSPLLFDNWRGGSVAAAGNSAARDCVVFDAVDSTWLVADCQTSRESVCVARLADFTD